MLILMFLLISVLTFFVVLFVTKPSKKEIELGKRLAGLDSSSATEQVVSPDILKREVYSDVAFVNSLLRRIKLTAHLNTLLKQANSTWTVGQLLFSALAIWAVVGMLSAVYLRSKPMGLVIGLVAANAPYIFLVIKRKARLNRFESVLPDAIDLMARALRAGHAVTAAIEMVAREIPNPVGIEFRRVFEEQNFGLPLREALLNLATRVPVPDLQFLVTAMLVQKETGGNLAEVLDKTAAVIRERSRLLGQLRIYTAQGRMTGWILGLLPFIVFAMMNFLNRGYARIMLDDPTGRKAIWLGLGLMTVGAWMIRKIVDIKV
ncbi:MAG: type II secretion system F family protein [Candidatus Korobacteraceae bacterium]